MRFVHYKVVIVFSAAAVRPHGGGRIRHQSIGLWPRVAIVVLELIDWQRVFHTSSS